MRRSARGGRCSRRSGEPALRRGSGRSARARRARRSRRARRRRGRGRRRRRRPRSRPAIRLRPRTPHFVWSATTTIRSDAATSARSVSASSRLGVVRPASAVTAVDAHEEHVEVQRADRRERDRPDERVRGRAHAAREDHGQVGPRLAVEHVRDLDRVRDDGQVGHLGEVVREAPGRRAGGEPDRLARLDEPGAARAIASFSFSWRWDFASNPGSSALRPPRERRAAVHLLQQAGCCEHVEIAADGHLGDARAASVSSLTRTAPWRRSSSTISLWRCAASMAPAVGDRTILNATAQVPSRATAHLRPHCARMRLTQMPRTCQCCAVFVLVRSCAVLRSRHPTQEEPHVGRPPPSVPPEELADEAGSHLTRRGLLAAAGVGGLAAALRPQSRPGPRRPAGVVGFRQAAGTVTLGSYEENAGDPGLARGHEALHQEDGNRRQDQHLRPRPLPGAHQQLPAGPPGGRLHVVRRLPDAVLRGEGSRDADRRRLGKTADGADAAGLQGRLDRRSTGTSTSCRTRTTRGPSTSGRASGRRRATPPPRRGLSSSRSPRRWTGGRADADRLHGQGRLAPDGHLRHHQHEDQRLQVPRRPHGREAGVGRPAGEGRLQEVDRALPVLLGRCARPELAGRCGGAREQAGRHVPARRVPDRSDEARRTRRTSTSSRSR